MPRPAAEQTLFNPPADRWAHSVSPDCSDRTALGFNAKSLTLVLLFEFSFYFFKIRTRQNLVKL